MRRASVEERESYEAVAAEYYEPRRHPTCDNFRAASALVLERWLPAVWPRPGLTFEVGAGRSLVWEVATRYSLPTRGLVLLDSSPAMLDHSRQLVGGRAKLCVADGQQLPAPDQTVDLVVASLGDPYNTEAFWREVTRVLRPKGWVIFATPSFEWSSTFRRDSRAGAARAEFMTAAGRRVLLPSFIHLETRQVSMMTACGLRHVTTTSVTVAELGAASVSPKLGCAAGGVVLTGYRGQRVTSG